MMLRLPRCPYLRRAFAVRGAIRRATLYATARGLVELELNGARVGDAVLRPGWTDYRRRIEYDAYDVTQHLRPGENVLGAILGDGWYAGMVGMDKRRPGNHYGREPELLCELHVEHADGSLEVIASDERWRATTGPLRSSRRSGGRSPRSSPASPDSGDGATTRSSSSSTRSHRRCCCCSTICT
jgi:alpha-L-rhamnosidase